MLVKIPQGMSSLNPNSNSDIHYFFSRNLHTNQSMRNFYYPLAYAIEHKGYVFIKKSNSPGKVNSISLFKLWYYKLTGN